MGATWPQGQAQWLALLISVQGIVKAADAIGYGVKELGRAINTVVPRVERDVEVLHTAESTLTGTGE